jgi:hypothetical protein
MPGASLSNRLNPWEAAQIVYGYMVFEEINADLYTLLPSDHDLFYGDSKPEQKSDTTPKFHWSIIHTAKGNAAHNIARVEQMTGEGNTKLCVVNDSVIGFTEQPEDAKLTHYFEQFNGVDCGFCAAFFVIHTIQYFEKEHKSKNVLVTQLPEPLSNPFKDKKATVRLQSAFYFNCIRLMEPKGAELFTIPSNPGDYKQPGSNGYDLFSRFFDEKKTEERAGLSKEAFLKFVQENLPRDHTKLEYEVWVLYQNTMLYFFLYRFKETCALIQYNPNALSAEQVLSMGDRVPELKALTANNKPNKRVYGYMFSCLEQNIRKEEFDAIVKKYKSSSWVSRIWFFSPYRSTAIYNLNRLSETVKDDFITISQIKQAIGEDGYRQRRLQLFDKGDRKDNQGYKTDDVILGLHAAFKRK